MDSPVELDQKTKTLDAEVARLSRLAPSRGSLVLASLGLPSASALDDDRWNAPAEAAGEVARLASKYIKPKAGAATHCTVCGSFTASASGTCTTCAMPKSMAMSGGHQTDAEITRLTALAARSGYIKV